MSPFVRCGPRSVSASRLAAHPNELNRSRPICSRNRNGAEVVNVRETPGVAEVVYGTSCGSGETPTWMWSWWSALSSGVRYS